MSIETAQSQLGHVRTSHSVRVISIISACHGLSHFYQLVTPSLFLFIAPALDLSYSQLATVVVLFSIVSSIGQPLSGIYVDRLGGLMTLVLGTLIYAVGIVLYSISQGWLTMLLASIIAGLGNSIYHPSDLSIINNKVSYKHLPVAYSCHVIGGQIGWILAPVSMTTLALIFDWRIALMVAAVTGFLVVVFLYLCRGYLSYPIEKPIPETARTETDKLDGKSTSNNDKTFIQMLAFPWIWLMMLFFAMHSMATMPIAQFGQVIFNALHAMSPDVIAVYISSFLIISCIGTIAGGYMLNKGGKKRKNQDDKDYIASNNKRQFDKANKMTIIAMTFAGVGYFAMSSLSVDTLIIAFVVVGLGVGFTSPLRDSLVRIMTGGRNQGKAYGIVYSGLDIGMVCAPLLGVLVDINLANYALFVPATASLLAVAIALLARNSNYFKAQQY